MHFVHSPNRSIGKGLLSDTIEKLKHSELYFSHRLLETDSIELSFTGYEQYPLTVVENEQLLVVMEGRIYDRDNIEHELLSLAGIVLAADQPDHLKQLRWLDSIDGEFLIFLHDKESKRTKILNDILGRLPTFYHAENDSLILTRELNLIPRLLKSVSIDRLALAQTLLFGFTLSGRTLMNNVHRLAPASLLSFNHEETAPKITTLHQPDYTYQAGRGSLKDNAVKLAELFTTACANRVNQRCQTVVSLSGGLDSRAIASALSHTNKSMVAHTFTPADKANDIESTLASRVCEVLGLEWKQYLLQPTLIRDIEKLINDTSGLCNIANTSLEPFIEDIRDSYDNRTVMFTGDGGDELLPSLVPIRSFSTLSDLADYIIERQQLLPPELACSLTGVTLSEFKEELGAVLESYPEPNLKDRFVHFMISERMHTRSFDGDDCNRNRLWTATPFFSWPFYKAAFTVDERPKRYHRLYRHFLDHLSHEAAALPDAKRGKSLLDKRYEYEQRLIRIMNRFPSVANRLKQRRTVPSRYTRKDTLIQLLIGLSETDSGLSEFVDRQSFGQMLSNIDSYSKESIDNFATACLATLLYTQPDFNLDHYSDWEL